MDSKTLLHRFLETGLGLIAPERKRPFLAPDAPDGLSVLQGLAQKAWSEGGADAWSVSPARQGSGDVPPLSESGRAQVLLQAMIAAAKVDGRLGEAEQQRLLAEMETQLAEDEASFLRKEMRRPPVLDCLARRLTTRAETVEVYAASLLAIDPERPVSRHYLDMLAARLGLERALVARIEETVAAHR